MIHNHSSGKHRLWRKVLSVCIAFAMICSVSISAFAVEASSETANENIETVQSGSAEDAEELTATEAENDQSVDEAQPEEPSAITGDEDTEEPAEVIEAPSEDTEEPTEPSAEPGEDTEQPADPTVTEQPEEPSVTPAEDADTSDEVQDVEMEAQEAQTEDEAAALAVNDGTAVDLTGATVTIEDTIKTDGCLKLKVTDKNGAEITADQLKNAGYMVTWYKDNNKAVSRKKVTGDSYNMAEDGSWVNVTLDKGAQKTYTVKITAANGNVVLQTASGVKVDYYDSLQNGSFETPVCTDSYQPYITAETQGIVWKTTAQDNQIEIVSTAKTDFKNLSKKWHGMSSAAEGLQYAELNANYESSLYQDVLTTPGSAMHWQVAHAARLRNGDNWFSGTDKMYVVIMASDQAENLSKNQSQLKKVAQQLANGNQTIDGVTYTGATSHLCTNSDWSKWKINTGDYTVPQNQYLTRYFFVSASSAANNPSIGNHLDNVWFSTAYPPANPGEGRITIIKKVYGLPENKLGEINKENLITYMAGNGSGTAALGDWKQETDSDGSTYYTVSYTTPTLKIPVDQNLNCTVSENEEQAKVSGYSLKKSIDFSEFALSDSSGNREKTVTITNTYTPTVTDITVKKEVTGSMGDKTKGFSFDFSYVNEEGSTIRETKTLKNGESFELTGVKIGSGVTLTEKNAANYTTSATYGNAKISPSEQDTSSETKTITVTNITADQKLITVTNNKEVIPDTGVNLNSTPYILMLGIMAAGAGVLLFRRRKRWS
ncbi:DUF5979 domain-containing protein [Blautia massiliensis (ex Liu et al. 2021)]|uniref:DUF5979 domain-containing protein n=1 Tax=Blautia massiliensis (ex Liu et al. 2021) TaxID=3062492 RepID=UPI003F8A3A73